MGFCRNGFLGHRPRASCVVIHETDLFLSLSLMHTALLPQCSVQETLLMQSRKRTLSHSDGKCSKPSNDYCFELHLSNLHFQTIQPNRGIPWTKEVEIFLRREVRLSSSFAIQSCPCEIYSVHADLPLVSFSWELRQAISQYSCECSSKICCHMKLVVS